MMSPGMAVTGVEGVAGGELGGLQRDLASWKEGGDAWKAAGEVGGE